MLFFMTTFARSASLLYFTIGINGIVCDPLYITHIVGHNPYLQNFVTEGKIEASLETSPRNITLF